MNFNLLALAAIVASPALMAGPGPGATPVNLGTAGNFAVLSKAGISTTGTTLVLGHIGVSPIGATAITGFGLTMNAANTSSTSDLVVGQVYASDYAAPTPANMTASVSDMEAAYTDAAGRAADVTELGAGNIGGMSLVPGVYSWSTGLTIPTDLTLTGNPTGVWIFQIAGTLSISSATHVILSGGALARNVFWQVAGDTTLGTTSEFKGVILDQTAIIMNTGASLDGRALAQTAITLDSSSINSLAGSALIDHLFSIASANDPVNNFAKVGVAGGEFVASGDVIGTGTAGQIVRIHYNAPQPTSASRGDNVVTVVQRKFTTVNVFFDDVSATGGAMIVEKSTIKGFANVAKLKGSTGETCTLDTVLALLTPDQIASLEAAFPGNGDVRVKINSTATKGSLSITCNGNATLD
jgi:hypothetical protein